MPGVLHAIERAGHHLARQLSGDFAGTDLTAAEAELLFHVIHGGEERAAIKRLRNAAGRTPSTTTAVVDRLQQRELVRREPNPQDRRSHLIVLTPRGRQVAKAVADRVRTIENRLEKQLKPEEIDAFHRVIEELEGL